MRENMKKGNMDEYAQDLRPMSCAVVTVCHAVIKRNKLRAPEPYALIMAVTRPPRNAGLGGDGAELGVRNSPTRLL